MSPFAGLDALGLAYLQHTAKGDSSQPVPFSAYHARGARRHGEEVMEMGETHPGVKCPCGGGSVPPSPPSRPLHRTLLQPPPQPHPSVWRAVCPPPRPPHLPPPLAPASLLSCHEPRRGLQMRGISALAHATLSTTGGLYLRENLQSRSHEPSLLTHTHGFCTHRRGDKHTRTHPLKNII